MTETRPDSPDGSSRTSSDATKAPAKAAAPKAPAKTAAGKAPTKAAARKVPAKAAAQSAPAQARAAEREPISGPAPAKRPGAGADAPAGSTSALTADALTRAEVSVTTIRELNERAITVIRNAGQSALDAYQTALEAIVSLEQRLAGATSLEWVSTVVRTQAELAQSIANAYLSAARDLLR